MADTGFQASVIDGIARVIGGTVTTADSHFYSGDQMADGTGVAGVKGCYSTVPNAIQSSPTAVVYPGRFTAQLNTQGEEENHDLIPVILYVARYNDKIQMAILNAFRDTVPAAFRTHMQLYGAANVLSAFVADGEPAVHSIGGVDYLAWKFVIHVERVLPASYTA